jgi:Uma2 family endonuclease
MVLNKRLGVKMSSFKEELLELLQTAELPEDILRQRLKKILEDSSKIPKMSYEEFLEWADEDTLAEWVNGEVILSSPAGKQHQKIGIFLERIVGFFVEHRQLGEILTPPFQMKLSKSGREPDLLFIKQKHLDRLKENYIDGPADLAVEIISPESAGRDRGEKFYEYEQAGIPEYWLIDPEKKRAEFYVLNSEGNYDLAKSGSKGKFDSRILPGFWLSVEWLWADPLPSTLRIVAEIAGIDPALAEKFEQALRKG